MSGFWIPGEGWAAPQTAYDDERARRRVAAGTAPPEPPGSPYYVPAKPPGPVAGAIEALVEVVTEPVLSAAEKARQWLVSELTTDPIPSLELQERARKARISWRTIRRVAKAAGVRVFKKGAQWFWELPAEDGPSKGGRIPARPSRRKVIADPFA
jgi:hypothetical protein